MKFWVYDKARRDATGPFETADLKKVPGFGPDTIVAPDGAANAQAWKPVSAYPELKVLFGSAPPPPPLPTTEPSAATSNLVSCPSCGKSLAENALTCPSCGRLLAGIAGKYDKVQTFLVGSGILMLLVGGFMAPAGPVGLFCMILFGGLGLVLLFTGTIYSLFRKKKGAATVNHKPAPTAGNSFATGAFYFFVSLAVLGLIWLARAS